MGTYKTPSEGGSGGRRGHSNMEHWTETEELKEAARIRRRQDDKSTVEEGVADLRISDLTVDSVEQIKRLPAKSTSVYVQGLDDAKCAAIAQALPDLQVLYQSGGPGSLTDHGVSFLAELSDLRILDLEWAKGLSDASMPHLRRLSKSSWLDLGFCSGISDAAIAELRTALPTCDIVV